MPFKRILAIILTVGMLAAVLPLTVSAAKIGDTIDWVLYTDIATYINGYYIPSYNINGKTAVIVEDLLDYGFDVVWNASARTLSVKRDYSKDIASDHTPDKNARVIGSRVMPVLYTDIVTYFEGTRVTSYNVDGRTIVYADDLAAFYQKDYSYDNATRTLKLTLDAGASSTLRITQQPQDITVSTDSGKAQFTVGVSGGVAPYTYRWQVAKNGSSNFTDLSKSNTFSLNYSYTGASGTSLRCVVTDASGAVMISEPAKLLYVHTPEELKASISAERTSAALNTPVLLTCTATGGTGDYLYTWYRNNERVSRADFATYTARETADGTYRYYCMVANGTSSVKTDVVTITYGTGTPNAKTLNYTASVGKSFSETILYRSSGLADSYASVLCTHSDLSEYGLTITAQNTYASVTGTPSKAGVATARYTMTRADSTTENVTISVNISASSSGAASGFSTMPTVVSSNGTDTITFTPSVSGYVYIYYSNSSTVPTAAEFMTLYNRYDADALSTVPHGKIAVTDISKPTNVSNGSSDNASYRYLVFLLTDLNGRSYTPLVISHSVVSFTSDPSTGFTGVPTATPTAVNDVISLVPTAAGTVYYYFADSDYVPAAIDFRGFYNMAAHKGSMETHGASTQSSTYSTTVPSETASANGYTCIVLMFVDSQGVSHQPVGVIRGASGSGDPSQSQEPASSNGFKTDPTVTATSTYDTLSFATDAATGMVYYYYTNSTSIPTAAAFPGSYDEAAYKGTVAAGTVTLNTSILSSTIDAAGYTYVMLMYTAADGTNHQPVGIIRSASGSGSSSASTGITGTPTVTATSSTDTLSLAAGGAGILYYYYTASNTAPTSEGFLTNYENMNPLYKGNCIVRNATTANVLYSTTVSSLNATSNGYLYVAVMYSNTAGVLHRPIVIERSTGTGPTAQFGLTAMPTFTFAGQVHGNDSLTFTPAVTGTFFYYYTNEAPADSMSAIQFFASYGTAAYQGSEDVSAGETVHISVKVENDAQLAMKKIVLMMGDVSGNFYKPVVISVTRGS